MKNITGLLSFVLLLTLSISLSFSQEKSLPDPAQRASKMTEWMKTNLQLSEDQVPKIQDLNLKYANKNQELLDGSQSRRQKFQAAKANDKAKDEELKSILTPEQYNSYQDKKSELRKELKEKAKEKRASS